MKQRNYALDLLKFYLALIIAVGHTPFPASFPVVESGYVVAMFFLISGYFLVASFDSGKYSGPWQYTLNRVKKLYPYYMTAFVVMFVYMHRAEGLRSLVLEFFRCLPEMLMLQSIGIFPGGLNYPLWQLSTLVVVSFLLFALLQWDRKTAVNLICPALVLLCYNYYIGIGNGNVTGAFLPTTLVRATGSLCLGMFLYDPIRMLLGTLEGSSWKGMPVAVSAVSLFLLPVLWTNRMSYALLIPFVGIVAGMLYSKGIWARCFASRRWRWLDRLSLGLYVNHALIVRIFEDNPALYERIPLPPDVVFLAVLIPYCIVMMAAVDGLVKVAGKLWKKAVAA